MEWTKATARRDDKHLRFWDVVRLILDVCPYFQTYTLYMPDNIDIPHNTQEQTNIYVVMADHTKK